MSAIRYIIEVIVCSGLFLVAYRWLLAKKVSFGLCRAFIIASMLLAVAIPAMNVPLFPEKTLSRHVILTEFDFFEDGLVGNEEVRPAGEAQVSAKTAAETVPEKNLIYIKAAVGAVAKVIYVLVALASLGLTIFNIIKIQRLRGRSKLTHTEDYTLAEHEEVKTPFSFLLTIFMGFNYLPEERKQILIHEASHVRHRHSFERLTLSILRSVFWFNPFFWMAEKDLEEVQEWEADKDVLSEGYELKTYRTTIFKQLFGYNPDISCGLNHSLTKQRFIMMTQSRRGKGASIRLAATFPLIAAAFFAFGCGTKEAKASNEVSMCPPCDATVRNSFSARADAAGAGTHQGDATTTVTRSANGAFIEVIYDPDGSRIYIDGVRHSIDEIAEVIGAKRESSDDPYGFTVQIKASSDTPMGIINDIKLQLRKCKALKVRYEGPESSVARYLPPAPDSDMYTSAEEALRAVDRRNIIVMRVNAAGEMFLGDTYVKGSLHDEKLYRKEIARLKELISNPEDKADCPDHDMKEFQMPDGSSRQIKVSNGIITFRKDRATRYEDYAKAMNLITTAYMELREELSEEVFGRSLAGLSDAEMRVVYQAVPMVISEIDKFLS